MIWKTVMVRVTMTVKVMNGTCAERTTERTLERATRNAEGNWNAHPRATKYNSMCVTRYSRIKFWIFSLSECLRAREVREVFLQSLCSRNIMPVDIFQFCCHFSGSVSNTLSIKKIHLFKPKRMILLLITWFRLESWGFSYFRGYYYYYYYYDYHYYYYYYYHY